MESLALEETTEKKQKTTTRAELKDGGYSLTATLSSIAQGKMLKKDYESYVKRIAGDFSLLMQSDYESLRLNELLEKDETQKARPSYSKYIDDSNRISNYIRLEILNQPTPEERANLIKFFINVQERCIDSDNVSVNYAAYAAIGNALSNSNITRLKETIGLLSSAERDFVGSLEAELTPSVLKKRVNQAQSAYPNKVIIPPMAAYQKLNITVADFQRSDKVKANDVQGQMMMVGSTLEELVGMQEGSKKSEAKNQLQFMLIKPLLSQQSLDDKLLYELSKKLEPGERKSVSQK
jgi:hypothetical protein